MTYANRIRRRICAVAVAAAAIAVAGGTLAAPGASAAQVSRAHDMHGAPGLGGHSRDTVLFLNLAPMPQGTVSVSRGGVTVTAFGLTPGSAHAVELFSFGGPVMLGTLTASAAGQASAIFPAPVRPFSTLTVLNTGPGSAPIAVTGPLLPFAPAALHAIDAGVFSPLFGQATVVYDPGAQTVTVTVTASGFAPGLHAAHIHAGSCQSQGPVLFPLVPDLTADRFGFISHETRVITGVTSFDPAAWYLNLHLGNSNDILDAAGNPTPFFRPLLCANL